ncbi:MAG: carbamoyltransferase [Candidatus Odinarchaeota archaeon]
MRVLGVNILTHDVSFVLIEDNKIIAAVEEERFSRNKHHAGLLSGNFGPLKSLKWIYQNYLKSQDDIDFVAFAGKIGTNISFKRLKENYLKLANHISSDKNKTIFLEHHLCHASSTFRCSGFEKALMLTIDGEGDGVSTAVYYAESNNIHLLQAYPASQSLGHLYSFLTRTLGLGNFGAEGKTMGLSCYGEIDQDFVNKNYIKLTSSGYIIDEKIFLEISKYKRNTNSEGLGKKHKDIAATIQFLIENTIIHLISVAHNQHKISNICLAGGVALNCIINSKIKELPFIENVFVQPAANDAGTAMGAAFEVLAKKKKIYNFSLSNAYLGPSFSNEEIEKILSKIKLKYEKNYNLSNVVSQLLIDQKIVGWFQGRMEFGPRALGNRSILADPRKFDIKKYINEFVKHREMWRPFAPVILEEEGTCYFDNFFPTPFMTFTQKMKREKIEQLSAVSHIDCTARVQSISKSQNNLLYSILKEFENNTGVPILLNTSFNDNKMPIVCTPLDAIKTFYSTGLDVLVLGNYVIFK